MGLFDPVRIPAQEGDWLMLESFNDIEPECVWITFLPIIAWRKETANAYVPEFLHEGVARQITSQKEAGKPWRNYFIRDGMVMDFGGESIMGFGEWIRATAHNYRIKAVATPARLRDDVVAAVERSYKLNPYKDSEGNQ